MKLAFVWKGGSGKTTLTASFIRYLNSNNIFTIGIDADINVWLASALGIDFDITKYLSHDDIVFRVREYLRWENKKIVSSGHIVKTTPPWKWSRLITRDSQDFFQEFTSHQDSQLKFFHVGTYEPVWVGISCYHSHLSIYENILSHTYLRHDEFLIADMVAGNDAFSNTLFTQFDVLCLIVEPTHESVSLVHKYLDLMKTTESSTKIIIIANKIEDENDLKYLERASISPSYVMEYDKSLKHARQNNENYTSKKQYQVWQSLYKELSEMTADPNQKLNELYILHKKYIELDYIKTPLWDLSTQIDETFQFSWK